jgi:hypothetical protein
LGISGVKNQWAYREHLISQETGLWRLQVDILMLQYLVMYALTIVPALHAHHHHHHPEVGFGLG